MDRHDDEFWGSTGDWTPTTRATPRSTPRTGADRDRTRPLDAVRRGWSNLLGGGVDATREHGIVRPTDAATSLPPDPFDFDAVPQRPRDLTPSRQPAVTPGHQADVPLIVPAPEPRRALTHELLRTVPADRRDDTARASRPVLFDDDRFLDDGYAGLADDHTGPVDLGNGSERPLRHHGGGRDADHGAYTAWDDDFVPEAPAAAIDPLLARLGAIAVVAALLVPLGLNLRSDGDDALFQSAATPTTTPLAAAPTPLDQPDTPPAEVAAAPTLLDATPEAAAAEPTADATMASEQPAAPAASASAGQDEGAPVAAAPAATAPAAVDRSALQGAPTEAGAAADAPAERVERLCAIDYDVVAGDYWIRLADGAGVPIAELLEANGASASTPLYPGEAICLPAGSTTPAPPTTAAATTAPATTAPATTTPATTAPATTAPPATTTTTTSTVPAAPRTVEQLIRDIWPDELEEKALQVAWRESNYVPTAKNFCCYGIFQIYWNVHKGWLDDIGVTDDQQLYDPETNIRAAYVLYQRAGGWGPWSL